VPIRSSAEIRRDLESANASRTTAEASIRLATDLRDRSRLRIEVQKREISTLETRLKLAKKEKNAEDEARLKDLVKRMKVRQTLLERRADLRVAEIELAKALKELAEATATVHEQSLALAELRAQRIDLANDPSDPAAAARALKGREKLRDLESKVLGAQKREAERRVEAGKRESQLAELRRKLFEAQIKMIDSAT